MRSVLSLTKTSDASAADPIRRMGNNHSQAMRQTVTRLTLGSSAMPADASKTREKLVDAAARAFAADGVFTASLIEITRRADQRNRGALHYHFGSRVGVLRAVLDRHVDFLARREGELLEL